MNDIASQPSLQYAFTTRIDAAVEPEKPDKAEQALATLPSGNSKDPAPEVSRSPTRFGSAESARSRSPHRGPEEWEDVVPQLTEDFFQLYLRTSQVGLLPVGTRCHTEMQEFVDDLKERVICAMKLILLVIV